MLPQNSQENRRERKRDAGVAPASLEVQTHRVSPGTAKALLITSSLASLSSPAISVAFIVGLGISVFWFGAFFFFTFSSLKRKYLLPPAFDIWGL